MIVGACFLFVEQEVNLFSVVAVKNYGRKYKNHPSFVRAGCGTMTQ